MQSRSVVQFHLENSILDLPVKLNFHCFALLQSVFDDLEGEEMRQARTRSNPYESIRGVFFLNR